MPKHMLHIYEKPAVGSDFIQRFTAFNYRHKISANGGFDTASCSISVSQQDAEIIFDNYIGNRVATFIDNPCVPAWEGYINRITLYAGSIQQTVSLDQMSNRVLVQWSTGQGGIPAQTAEATDTESIALYGSKMTHVDLGELYTTNTGLATAVRDALSSVRSVPQKSSVFTPGGASGGFVIQFEMLGFYHTLKWDTFSVTAADSTGVPLALFGANYTYNDNIFYDLTNVNHIEPSTSYTAPATRKAGESTWEMLLRFTEALSNSERFIAGITPFDPNNNTRAGYFQAINDEILYTVDAYSDGRIKNMGGGFINPWDVTPDNFVLIRNMMIGKDAALDSGKIVYIKAVDYDAESGSVSWQSEDDITLPGVLNLNNKGALATNETFGAPARWQVTSDYVVDSMQAGNIVITGNMIETIGGGILIEPLAGQNVGVSLSGAGDWFVNTNQQYTDTSSGFTGFGTSTPAQRIDVVGNAQVSGIVFNGSFSGTINAGATSNIGLTVGTSEQYHLRAQATNSGKSGQRVFAICQRDAGGTMTVTNVSSSTLTAVDGGSGVVQITNGSGTNSNVTATWIKT